MEAIHFLKVIENDGEIILKGLPYKKGEKIKMILFSEHSSKTNRPTLTSRLLINSGLIGMWKDRKDIQDSSLFARKLRNQAQDRSISV